MSQQPAPGLPAATPDEERERAIESLLVAGLDRYFAGEHERAIHAWTRVLFLDRTHPRARAYIERARSVLAEQQRETDELLHRGLAALDAGDIEHAKALLSSAVRRGGPVEAAEAALQRLVRLDVASGADAPPIAPAQPVPSGRAKRAPDPRARVVSRLFVITTAGVLLAVAVALALGWRGFDVFTGDSPRRASTVANAPVTPLPLPQPSPSDLALHRARQLHARGHLHQALAELEAIRYDDPLQPEANRLRAEIQAVLLQSAGEVAAPSAPTTDRDRP